MFKLNDRKVRAIMVAVLMTLVLTGCVTSGNIAKPIAFDGSFIDKFFIYPVAWLLYQITKFLGGNYALGVVITTLVIRTIAWPIYAKGTASSMKMQEIQPEMQKIQNKYAGRNDDVSQRKMQMEIQALYKKNGVSMFGCLTPFLQMPIFLVIYNVVYRLPNNLTDGNVLVLGEHSQVIDPNLFGLNMLTPVSVGIKENLLYIIIPLLSAATMLLMQMVILHHQKKNRPEVPEYRRNPQVEAMDKQMKFMTIFMVLMFAAISFTSVATLGLYWAVGNVYSLVQQLITQRQREKMKKNKVKDIIE